MDSSITTPAHKDAFVIFAKAPQPGNVKTRLQPYLSQDESAELYKRFIVDTVTTAEGLDGVDAFVACLPCKEDPAFSDLVRDRKVSLIDQRGHDLGERMHNVLRYFITRGYNKVVIVGADSPSLPLDYISMAYDELDRKHLVVGPSYDGGYYLLGAAGVTPDIFDQVPWSTMNVFNITLRKARAQKLEYAVLPYWYDVDTIRDVHHLCDHLTSLSPMDSGVGRHTMQYLSYLIEKGSIHLQRPGQRADQRAFISTQ